LLLAEGKFWSLGVIYSFVEPHKNIYDEEHCEKEARNLGLGKNLEQKMSSDEEPHDKGVEKLHVCVEINYNRTTLVRFV
jgi:hypothetical protein